MAPQFRLVGWRYYFIYILFTIINSLKHAFYELAKIYRPTLPYNPKGIFTYFENYNVEVRDRVKCISGAEGLYIYHYFGIIIVIL